MELPEISLVVHTADETPVYEHDRPFQILVWGKSENLSHLDFVFSTAWVVAPETLYLVLDGKRYNWKNCNFQWWAYLPGERL